MGKRSVAEGRFVIPTHWPKWKLRCGAKRRNGSSCTQWAVIGMPTCRFHGSGGVQNERLGQLRYLAWVVCGGPQDMPVEHACRIALALYAERAFSKNEVDPEKQFKAALMITKMLD